MRLRIFTEPQQGGTYDQLVAMARLAEALGFDAFFRSDHYLVMGDTDGAPGPTDAWITLAGIARETSQIRLGTLVTAATFRWPGVLAISVAQVDQMSAGRIELGLGAAWYTDEHTAYGIPFPDTGERMARLEEQLAIVTGIWATPEGETFSHAGAHYSLEKCPALPKPVQRPRPPIIVGGYGTKRTPRIAASYADEFNLPFPPLDYFRPACDFVRAACDRADRDSESMRYSVALVACVGTDDDEFARRANAIGRSPDELRANGACGTPGESVERILAYDAAGADTAYLQILDLDDLDHLRLIAAEVAPHVS